MARFSEQFLQSLTQPSFGQGLFQVGQAVGQIPTYYSYYATAKRKERNIGWF